MQDDERRIIDSDPTLPGLRLLFDTQMMRGVLNAYLPETHITELHRCYIRYKHATNCLVKFILSTTNNDIALYAKAYRRDDDHKLTKTSLSELSNEHRLILHEHSVVICLFPFDEKLRILTRLLNPVSRTSLLKRVLHNDNEFSSCSLEVLQYKPERRFVARLHNEHGQQAVLKLYTQPRYQNAINTCRQTVEGQRVLPLIGRSNKHHILIYRWLPGQTLSEVWLQPEFAPDNLRLVGEHLAHFHRRKQSEKYTLRNSESYCASLTQLASDLVQLLPTLNPDIGKLATNIAKRIRKLHSKMTRIHGDFYAKQVLINSGKITLIDLDDTCRWYPACDLGLFIAHVERDCLHGKLKRDHADRYIQALLTGYKQIKNYRPYQVWLFTAASLLQLAHHPFRNCEPRWPELTIAMIQRSEECLHKALRYKNRPSPLPCEAISETEKQSTSVSDASMPFLSELQDIAYIERIIIDSLCARCPTLHNARLTDIIALRHKPGKRAVLEYVFQPSADHGVQAISVIGKVRAKGFDQRTWQANRELAKTGFCCYPPRAAQIPMPLGTIPKYQIWFQKKITGDTLFSEFCHVDGCQLAQRLARTIHQLHNSSVTLSKSHTKYDELKILHQRLKLVGHQHPKWHVRLTQLLEQCNSLAAKLPLVLPQPIHRDFYHDQVIVTKDELYLLDLDLLAMGDPALDLGNFIAHIQEQCLREFNDLHYADRALDNFVTAYQSLTTDTITPRIEIYRLLSLVRHIYISQRISTRSMFTESILRYCENTIQALLSR